MSELNEDDVMKGDHVVNENHDMNEDHEGPNGPCDSADVQNEVSRKRPSFNSSERPFVGVQLAKGDVGYMRLVQRETVLELFSANAEETVK